MNDLLRRTLPFLGLIVLVGCATSAKKASPVTRMWDLAATPLDRTAAEFENWTAEHIAWADVYRLRIHNAGDTRTIENTLVPYNDMLLHLEEVASQSTLLAMVHPIERVRAAAKQSERDVAAYLTEVSLDRSIFQAIAGMNLDAADPATRHAVAKILRDYRRAGVDQDDTTREQIAVLNEEILGLGRTFLANRDEDVRSIALDSVDQLDGLPADWIANHPPDEQGNIHVSTSYPDVYPFLMYAKSADAKKRLYVAFRNQAYPQNQDVLRRLIAKRHELAQRLGYAHWADYVTEDKMAENAANAQRFIDQVADVSRAAIDRDLAILLERKRLDDPDATAVQDWERYYYQAVVQHERFGFDPQSIREYLSFEDVLAGLFQLCEESFGVKFRQVRGLALWHPSVTAWDVFDGRRHVGRFYLDLHPRPGKYGHGACFGYRDGVASRRLPQAALVCNFANPAECEGGVALMEHKEVVVLFHEFGHLLHALFAGHRQWIVNAGISTERDFVEVPSSILEEWCFSEDTLRRFARHYQTREPIPVELVDRLREASTFGNALETGHQLFYSALSLGCYSSDPATLDLDQLARDAQRRYSPYPYVDGTHLYCSFGHLYGYSAMYYTYTWSKVIAKDMFSRFKAEGVLNPATARAFREAVLETGSSKAASAMVEDFLGRPYNLEAFQAWLTQSQ